MDWRMQIEMTEEWLERVVLLLLSLAAIAERAALAPDAQRRLTLAILRHGESAARDAFDIVPAEAKGTDPADALALAMSLRALAYVVRMLARQMRRGTADDWPADWAAHRHAAPIRCINHPTFPQVPGLDTS